MRCFLPIFLICRSNLSLLSVITPNIFSLQLFGNFIPSNTKSSLLLPIPKHMQWKYVMFEEYKYLRIPIENQVLRLVGSTNLLQPAVLKIWLLGNFGAFKSNFGPKNGFHPTFSLITKSILKIDPLSIPKQLLSRSLQ